MKKDDMLRFRLSFALVLGLLLILLFLSQWQAIKSAIGKPGHTAKADLFGSAEHHWEDEEKQRGAHVFGIVDDTDFQPLVQTNLEWITMVSWGFQDDYDSPRVTHHNGDSVYMLRHDSSWIRRIELVRAAGFKVFFKPHLWVTNPTEGKWRADIFPSTDAAWESWKETYRHFIIRYAKVAATAKADMFCVGGEFSRLSVEKPEFWENLIREIRSIYPGKLTYAANWYDEYEKITFWADLDYIGVQAYFPLTKNKYPSTMQVSAGWNKVLPALEAIHQKYYRRILFTEIGYRSTANSAVKPWEWVEDSSASENPYSAETQANCYSAFFNTVWEKAWFAGAHFWQLRSDHDPNNEKYKLDFTPQGKPAEIILTKGYEKTPAR